MKDSILKATLTGIIGALITNTVMYVMILLGLKTATPWQVAADIFLTPSYINTASGVIIGLIGTVSLGITSAFLILLVLRWTGYDYAVLKGIITVNALNFITMGLFMPILKIAPQVQKQPTTLYLALFSLTLAGAVMAFALKKFQRIQTNSSLS